MKQRRLQHLAIIMDGNRRWARQKGLFFWQGHEEGVQAARRSMEFCLQNDISYLSLYTFSIENFKRSIEEKKYLFGLVSRMAQQTLSFFKEHNIKVSFVGDRDLFPEGLRDIIELVEFETSDHTKLQVNFLFCYGGRQEIIGGIKDLIAKVRNGDIAEDAITEQDLESCLWMRGVPEPDLIMRTGGVQRLSNFLLFQAAYAELYFSSHFWPEIDASHLQVAVDSFYERQRNFGV